MAVIKRELIGDELRTVEMNKRKKIYVVDSCYECPNLIEYGTEYQCSELYRNKLWKHAPENFPKDCPLDDLPKDGDK